ncbi:MAG: DUF5661 family protein [Acidimicrobiia bacterium]
MEDLVRIVRRLQIGGAMFTAEDAAAALTTAGVDISDERFGLEDVRDGMNVELEHGTRFPDLDVSGDDPVITAKIALAHLREFPDYYERLVVMERKAKLPGTTEPGTGVEVG